MSTRNGDGRALDMDRLRRLSDFWNWLPAYRAVAETEHVRTAAERLRVSPSALSRSIGLLEGSLGERLFEREGRGIRLNRAGREFLTSLRAAMRIIDEGLQAVESGEFRGALHLAVPDDLAGLLWAGITSLRREHPELSIHLHSVPEHEIHNLMLSGGLDIAFAQSPDSHPDLEITEFAETANGIFCGQGHPLHGAEPSIAELLDHDFVAGVGPDGHLADSWPPHLRRKVAVFVNRLQAAVEATAQGSLLASLPEHVAAPHCERGTLYRIPLDVIPATKFFAIRRTKLVENDRNGLIVQTLATYSAAPAKA